MNILCKLGFHKLSSQTSFFPSIHAKIVTSFNIKIVCDRCGKVKVDETHVWDGKDFIKK